MATGQLKAEPADPWPDARGRAAARFLHRIDLGPWRAESRPGDASFRRYARLFLARGTAMLMDAPPGVEDVAPFVSVARRLVRAGLPAPAVLHADAAAGFLVLEDFGDELLAARLARAPDDEAALCARAVALLAEGQARCPADGLGPYDLAEYLREADLFDEWFARRQGHALDMARWHRAWAHALAPVLARQGRAPVLVLRDYHAENLMLVPDGRLGLIDFQDALAGHPAYDLVSLADDARRDVAPGVRAAMLRQFGAATGLSGEAFEAEAEVLSAQRLVKIVGVFHRLEARDRRTGYVSRLPRVWRLLADRLRHPALAGVAGVLADAGIRP